jgi:restriction system protein
LGNEEAKEHIEELRHRKMVDATKLSLNKWLSLLNPDSVEDLTFVCYEFPTEAMRNEYLSTISTRSEKEVKNLLRYLLIPPGSLGTDSYLRESILGQGKDRFLELVQIEHVRRLLVESPAWEGITWVMDLLPENPKLALDALWAFLVCHIQFLPDGRLNGLRDAMSVIRAKFIENPRSSVLSSLDPYQFELLVEALYRRMGYKTTLTQKTYDQGRDVIAEKECAGGREKVLIQCKRKEKNIGVVDVRALLGVVSHEKATKGVLVCTSEFTPEARKMEAQNHRLELIGNKALQPLLNQHLGSNWPLHVDWIISERQSKDVTLSPRGID